METCGLSSKIIGIVHINMYVLGKTNCILANLDRKGILWLVTGSLTQIILHKSVTITEIIAKKVSNINDEFDKGRPQRKRAWYGEVQR